MPSEQRGGEVRGAKDVEAPAEYGASDAVEDREVPGYLGTVDQEMGGDGAVFALGGEYGMSVGGSDGGCGGGSRGKGGSVGVCSIWAAVRGASCLAIEALAG